jgi:hypothetical protein
MMKCSAFYILFTKEFLRARGEHILLFALLLLLELYLLLVSFTLKQKLRESLGRLGKDENLGAS